MIELVIVYCLLADARQCIEQRLPMEPGTSAMACMIAGQQQASADAWERPKYRLARWRCEMDVPKRSET